MNIELTKQFEGCRLKAYPDPATKGAPWTIGFGHTRGVKQGDTCTQEQADKWLLEDMQWAIAAVKALVTVPLNDNQLTALADFVFNVGVGNFKSSTLLRNLNAGNYEVAAQQFARWIYAAGKVMGGLVRRRQAEMDLFLKVTV